MCDISLGMMKLDCLTEFFNSMKYWCTLIPEEEVYCWPFHIYIIPLFMTMVDVFQNIMYIADTQVLSLNVLIVNNRLLVKSL